jgi:hypothetical protein
VYHGESGCAIRGHVLTFSQRTEKPLLAPLARVITECITASPVARSRVTFSHSLREQRSSRILSENREAITRAPRTTLDTSRAALPLLNDPPAHYLSFQRALRTAAPSRGVFLCCAQASSLRAGACIRGRKRGPAMPLPSKRDRTAATWSGYAAALKTGSDGRDLSRGRRRAYAGPAAPVEGASPGKQPDRHEPSEVCLGSIPISITR